jgi:hypothetical protein
MSKDFSKFLNTNPVSMFMSLAESDKIQETNQDNKQMELSKTTAPDNDTGLNVNQSVKMQFEIEPSVTRNKRISLAITDRLREQITYVSKKYNVSMNNLIHKILENFFDNASF